MSEDECSAAGLLDTYGCIGDDDGWPTAPEHAGCKDAGEETSSSGRPRPSDRAQRGTERDGLCDRARIHHPTDRCREETAMPHDEVEHEMNMDEHGGSGPYLLSSSRTESSSSDTAVFSSSDSDSDSESCSGIPRTRWKQARRHYPSLTVGGPLTTATSPSPLPRTAQHLLKGKHGLRATRSRLSINALPNLLLEKTEELDLDYREINVNELDLEERPIGK